MAELERKAGYGLVIGLSITAMIGTGMFFGPAIAAQYAGAMSLFSWMILSLIGVFVGLCFAELASLFPDVGGVYEFAKKAYSRLGSFIVGWITWLVGSITSSLLIIAALDYLMPQQNPFVKIGLAIGLLLLLTVIALKGVEASTVVLMFFASITILVILSIIAVGVFHINPENYVPLFTNSGFPTPIFIALFFILETFVGWESATFMGGETRNPEKIIPRSIFITTMIVAALVIIFPIVILGIVPWQTLITFETPLTNIAFVLFQNPLISDLFNIAIFLCFLGSAAGGIVSTPRLILALAKDKLFIEQLSAIHSKWHTPHKAIFFQTIVSLIVIIAAFGDYQSLLSLLVPLAIIMYVLIILTVPILRKKYPDKKRLYKAPFGKVGIYFVSIVYIGIIVAWLVFVPGAITNFKKIISFVLFGIPIYFLINLYYNPEMLVRTVNSTARFYRFFERFLLPYSVRKEIMNIFSDMKGKKVLEFGSGVGSLTMHLAEAVGKNGQVYALDISPNNIRILNMRLKKSKHEHVLALHDEHFISRVHPDVPEVDMVFSVGNISYIQDIKRVLKDMHALLPENGNICLVEYVDYFGGIIPNQPWLDNLKEIEKMFREVGFSVRVRKKRGFLWRYLFIYGIKSEYDVPVI